MTFDAKTSKRLSKALGSFGPRKRASYTRRQSAGRGRVERAGSETIPITSTRSVGVTLEEGQIPVAAVLDFQRFVSDSGRLSVEFDEEAHPDELPGMGNPNMMMNRYSVGAGLNTLKSKPSLGELVFDPDAS